MKIAIFGLTITSSWGNGHATTFRSLSKALHHRGHHIDFIEKDVEWYASNRDLPKPPFCNVHLYTDWATEASSLLRTIADADVILIGSFFPDAIDLTRRLLEHPHPLLLFYDIDTPITLAHLRTHGRTAYLEASLIPEYDAYLSFTGGPALLELTTSFLARRAIAFFCSVDADIYHPTPPQSDFACALSYLGTYAPDRQPSLMHLLDSTARLLPDQPFLLAGPQYPETITWSPNVRRIIHLAPPAHPAFYGSSAFTLNLTRAEMIAAGWSPSVRLFEASACGAAIISDSWPGLDEFFTPGEQILLPANAAECARLLTDLSPQERTRIGARARDRILNEHTSQHRAQQFESIVATCSSPPNPSESPIARRQ